MSLTKTSKSYNYCNKNSKISHPLAKIIKIIQVLQQKIELSHPLTKKINQQYESAKSPEFDQSTTPQPQINWVQQKLQNTQNYTIPETKTPKFHNALTKTINQQNGHKNLEFI